MSDLFKQIILWVSTFIMGVLLYKVFIPNNIPSALVGIVSGIIFCLIYNLWKTDKE